MRFATVRERWPIVADHAEHLRIEALARTAPPGEVLTAGLAFVGRHGASPVVGPVWRAVGDAHEALGQLGDARDAWQQAIRHTDRPEEKLALALQAARSWEAEAQFEEAATAYVALWRDHPAVRGSEAAADGLLRAESRLGRPKRTAADWAKRSARLQAAYHNGPALEACDRALDLGPGDLASRATLLRRRADLLFRLRRYADAVQAFAALPAGPEQRFWHARSLARNGRVEDAIAGFRTVAAEAEPALAARALFLAGTLLDDDDQRPELAQEAFTQVAANAPAAAQRGEARWRLAWAAYRAGRMEEAAGHLRLLAADTPDPLDALRARYWLARAREASAPEEAKQALARIARELPFTYYGWRAAEHLGERTAVATTAGSPPPARLPAVRRQRAEILIGAGLDDAAALELIALRPRARSRADRIALGLLFRSAGRFHEAQRLMLDHDLLRMAKGPGDEDALAAWQLAWPRAFAEALEPAAQRHGVDTELVYAVMREESGYRPAVLSVVGAHGLTQIMPETGRRLAHELGREGFETRQLLEPPVNLELGAYYLSQLLARTGGRLSAAVASYNAGPGAVERWLARRGGLPDDVWVESIPYTQTRRYVKRVLRSVHVYRTLPGASAR